MWQAQFVFYISIALGYRELPWRLAAQRTVRAFTVVLLPPYIDGSAHIIEYVEPACVRALIADPSVPSQRRKPVAGPRRMLPSPRNRAATRLFTSSTHTCPFRGRNTLEVHIQINDGEGGKKRGRSTLSIQLACFWSNQSRVFAIHFPSHASRQMAPNLQAGLRP